jgi:hypothetical protein
MADVKSVEQVRKELLCMLSTAMGEWQDFNTQMDHEVTTVKPDFRIVYQNSGFFENKLEFPSTTESLAAFTEKQKFEYSASIDIPLNAKLIKVDKFSDIFEVLQDIKNLVEKSTILSDNLARALLKSIRPVICDLQGLMFPLRKKLEPLNEKLMREGFETLQEECKQLQERAREFFPRVSVTLSSSQSQPSGPMHMSFRNKLYEDIDKWTRAITKKAGFLVTLTADPENSEKLVLSTGLKAPLTLHRNGTNIGGTYRNSLMTIHAVASRTTPMLSEGQELSYWTLSHDTLSRSTVLVRVLRNQD